MPKNDTEIKQGKQGKDPHDPRNRRKKAADAFIVDNTTDRERRSIRHRADTSPGSKHRTTKQKRDAARKGMESRAKRNFSSPKKRP